MEEVRERRMRYKGRERGKEGGDREVEMMKEELRRREE